MEDEDFFLDDDDLSADNQLSIVDIAKDKLLESIEKATKTARTNLKFNERKDASSQIRLVSNYTGLLVQLESIDEENTSVAEQQEIIDEILKQTTELTLGNIDDVLKDEDLNGDIDVGDEDDFDDDDTDDGSSLDF